MRFFRSYLNALCAELVVLGVAGLVALNCAPRAFCQVTTAAIHGIVTDPSGAVVPGARITALNTETGITTVVTANQSGLLRGHHCMERLCVCAGQLARHSRPDAELRASLGCGDA